MGKKRTEAEKYARRHQKLITLNNRKYRIERKIEKLTDKQIAYRDANPGADPIVVTNP